jgi:hypothetical protein
MPMRRRLAVLASTALAVLLAASPVSAAAPPAGGWAPLTTPASPLQAAFFQAVMGMEQGPDGLVYAFGWFTNADGDPTADYLAVYDPATGGWHGIGSNGAGDGVFNAPVRAVAWYHGLLYAGGDFINVGGVATSDYLAAWNGSTWTARTGEAQPAQTFSSPITSLAATPDYLYVGGGFANAAGIASADSAAVWNGRTWSALAGAGALDGPFGGPSWIEDLAALPDGRVYVVGEVMGGGSGIAGFWDPASENWNGIGGDLVRPGFGSIYALVLGSNAAGATTVTIGGSFLNWSGDSTADNAAFWNGSAWSGLGSNGVGDGAISGVVYAMRAYGANIIIGGDFDGDIPSATANLAAWNGSDWLPIGTTGVDDTVYSLLVTGRTLYAGGIFTDMGGFETADSAAAYGLPAAPSAPRSPKGTTGSKRVSLTWAAPAAANGAAVTDYVIQYRRVGTAAWKTFADGVRTARTAVVKGLHSGWTYQFRVLAKNGWGTGPSSPVVVRRAG